LANPTTYKGSTNAIKRIANMSVLRIGLSCGTQNTQDEKKKWRKKRFKQTNQNSINELTHTTNQNCVFSCSEEKEQNWTLIVDQPAAKWALAEN
jgi:hypothetical protein